MTQIRNTQSEMSSPPAPLLGGSSALLSGLYALAMLAMFVGERLVGVGRGRTILTGAGFVVVLAMLAIRLVRAQRSGDVGAQRLGDDRARVERTIAFLQGLGFLAVLLYFLQSDLSSTVLGKPLERDWPKLQVALQAVWPSLWLAALVPLTLVEISYASMVRAPRLEIGRVRDAMLSGFGLAGALVFCFAITYVATARDKKVDLSYFRTSRPGEATRKIVQTLDKPVQISYFYPPANEVREEIKNYLDELAKESKFLEVANYDHAVDPAKAKELGVSGNGILVVSRGGRREQLSIAVELESARSQLKNLDKEIQKRLVQVARSSKTIYLVTGHGERSTDPAGDTDKRSGIRAMRQLLLDQGYAPRDSGAAEGLAADVPADAGTVLLIGPTKPLLPEESSSLVRYVRKGGHLFVALDAEAGLDYKELLGPLGLVYKPTVLANDQAYAPVAHQNSDRANIATRSYSSHPTVSVLGRSHLPVILLGAGALEESKDRPKGAQLDFTIHAHPATWNDLNGNFAFDAPDEIRKAWELAAAVTIKKDAPAKPADPKAPPVDTGADEGRVVVLGDSDLITDAVIGSVGNAYVLVDGMKWLLGDEAIAGETNTEQDIAITHTRTQDVVWFYSTIFVAPGLVLGVGALATRRRRKRGRKGRSSGAGPAVSQSGSEAGSEAGSQEAAR